MTIKYSLIIGAASELTEASRLALTVQGYQFSKKGLDKLGVHYHVGERKIGEPNAYQDSVITKVREQTIHSIINNGLEGIIDIKLKIPEQKPL